MSRRDATVRLYDTIFSSFQDFDPSALEESHRIIIQCLMEAGFDEADLPTLGVLNVGTGREAVVFNSLGAAEVYHFDLSPRSVRSLTSWCSHGGISNVVSRQADICLPGSVQTTSPVDLCYLRGVLHHLERPDVAVRNLRQVTKPGGVLHFRIYKSGSFFFFVASFARSLVTNEDFEATFRAASEMFGDEGNPKGRTSETMDHLFVPVLSLWDVEELDGWFARHGLLPQPRSPFFPYDHEDLSVASRAVSLYYRREKDDISWDDEPFPDSRSQETDIYYHEDYVGESLSLMPLVRGAVQTWDSRDRVQLAVDCMSTAFTWGEGAPGNAREAHRRFAEVLKSAL